VNKQLEALICGNCDIPASRKLGGFLGHSAFKGCSRYLKSFPTPVFGGPTDFSGFDRSTWQPRIAANHRLHGMAWKHAITLLDQHETEHDYGVRYTELLKLTYLMQAVLWL